MRDIVLALILCGFPSFLHSDERQRLELAKAWAPIIYQELDLEFTHALTGFNPVDHLVGLHFDGNENLRDNGETIFSLAPSREIEIMNHVPVYFSVIETESHYYINYILYHAVDKGGSAHIHDTENLWVIVEKVSDLPYGRLVANLANAHGLAMIYLPNLSEELAWRARLPQDFRRKLTPLVDRFSAEHNEIGRPEYFDRGSSQSLKIFVAARTHAIYKLNEGIWQMSRDPGLVYYPEGCDRCSTQLRGATQKYSLVDWDLWTTKTLARMTLNDESSESIFDLFSEVEKGQRISGTQYVEKDLPRYLASSYEGEEPAAIIFYRTTFGSDSELIDPASTHRYFSKSKSKISHRYLQNSYLETAGTKTLKMPGYTFRNSSILHLMKNLFGMTQE